MSGRNRTPIIAEAKHVIAKIIVVPSIPKRLELQNIYDYYAGRVKKKMLIHNDKAIELIQFTLCFMGLCSLPSSDRCKLTE